MPAINEYFHKEYLAVQIPEDIDGADFAEKYCVLGDTSPFPGPWNNARFPYLTYVLRAATLPFIRDFNLCAGTQIGKTEMKFIIMAQGAYVEPLPAIAMYPTEKDADFIFEYRFIPMLKMVRNNIFNERIIGIKGNTINFIGGYITAAWSGSINSVSSKPAGYLYLDEIDKYKNIKGHGSAGSLVDDRRKAFPNGKIYKFSTPTVVDGGIWLELEKSEASFRYHLICPDCGKDLLFSIEYLKKKEDRYFHSCPHCEAEIDDLKKKRMLTGGFWKDPESGLLLQDVLDGKVIIESIGFQISSLYSPVLTWKRIYKKYQEALKKPELLQVFNNGWLAIPFDHVEDVNTAELVILVKENYDENNIPSGVIVVTCAVDVQRDRLEALWCGWGVGEECWVLKHKVLYGDPKLKAVWSQLDREFKKTKFKHVVGGMLSPRAYFVDSGDGHTTHEVYAYTKKREAANVFSIKGANQFEAPLVGRFGTGGALKAKLLTIGEHIAKVIIYNRLQFGEVDNGLIHFPSTVDKEFLAQVKSEKLIAEHKGTKRVEKWVNIRKRNEALDLLAYNLCAITYLNPDFDKLSEQISKRMGRIV